MVHLHRIKVFFFFILVTKEKLFVELLTTFHQKSYLGLNMMKWSMYGVLVSFAMNLVLVMLLFSPVKVDRKLTGKSLILT